MSCFLPSEYRPSYLQLYFCLFIKPPLTQTQYPNKLLPQKNLNQLISLKLLTVIKWGGLTVYTVRSHFNYSRLWIRVKVAIEFQVR